MNLTPQTMKQPDTFATNGAPREQSQPTQKNSSLNQLLLGVLFGVIFGFLLQKGGVAKYHVLIAIDRLAVR